MKLEEYLDYVPKALLAFQFLEEALRQYLMRCEVMTAQRLQGITEYDSVRGVKNLEKLSLGQLADRFARFNRNDDLIKRIRDVIEDRNFIAHQSFVVAYEKGKPKGESDLTTLYARTVAGKEKAEKCFFDTWNETEELERKFIVVQGKSKRIDGDTATAGISDKDKS